MAARRMLVLLLAPLALANLSSYDSQLSSVPAASAPSSYIGGGSQVQSQALPQAQAPSQGLPSGHDQDQDLNKCIDIMCFKKIAWSDQKEEVCRYRKDRSCAKRSKEVCTSVPKTECELVGYTECTTSKDPKSLRDDKVGGAAFDEQTCETKPVTITEMKTKPECHDETKEFCEKMWIPEAPFWKDVNCETKTWENCTLVPHPHPVEIDYCTCDNTEIWYNSFERNDVNVDCLSTVCEPKVVPKCTQTFEQMCKVVEWEECTETCDNECSEMHFKEPSQKEDHRRWCSHVDILLPPGVSHPSPSSSRRGGRSFTSRFHQAPRRSGNRG